MGGTSSYKWFYYSLLAGVLIWSFCYYALPVEAVEKIKIKTFVFIGSCYGFFIAGYTVTPSFKGSMINQKIRKAGLFNIIVGILFLAFVLRWIDLFYVRDVSFYVEPKQNRLINANSFYKNNLIFIAASILKSLYFFPFVLYTSRCFAGLKKVHLIFSCLILLLPFVEAIVLGTRKSFFDILLVVVVTLVLWRGIELLSFKAWVYIAISIFLVLVISATVLFKRESATKSDKNVFFDEILEAKYNDLLEPKDWVISFIRDRDENEYLRMSALTLLQTGQYMIHGIFEFNHLIDKEFKTSYGAYTFYPFVKLIRVVEGHDYFEPSNESPREIVYLTAFGGFFLDFKWFSVLVFFAFGIIQKVVFNKSRKDCLYLPLVVYFLIINVFLPVFHYLRGAGMYPLVGFVIVATILLILENRFNEKGFSS